jgi:hypothetical protein
MLAHGSCNVLDLGMPGDGMHDRDQGHRDNGTIGSAKVFSPLVYLHSVFVLDSALHLGFVVA